MNRYYIIFRCCDAVQSVHDVPRPFGLDKRAIIKACFRSLLESVRDFPHEITVLGDRLSEEMLEFFGHYPVHVLNEKMDNERSILKSVEIAAAAPSDHWVYFCEDDYIHTPWAFKYIDNFINSRLSVLGESYASLPLVIHPPDYPDRYKSNRTDPSLVFVSQHCHWRQICKTTFTLMTEASTIRRYQASFTKASFAANDALLSEEIYFKVADGSDGLQSKGVREFFGRLTPKNRNKALCISPMPGLSSHLHEGVMTPLVDWAKLLNFHSHD